MRAGQPIASMLLLLLAGAVRGQFEGDDRRYRCIALEDLPAELAAAPNALLLDFRSVGEFNDTAAWAGLNIGRLKGAIHIGHKELPHRLAGLGVDRDRPIIVYCSHSQRSRRASNALVDSGFTHVINLNAGLSRYWLERDRLGQVSDLIERAQRYGILNAVELCTLLSAGPVSLVDVRPDTLLDLEHRPERVWAMGRVNGAVHIPRADLPGRMQELPHDRPIVLFDEGGSDAPRAADLLLDNGFTDVHVLFDGLSGLMELPPDRFPCRAPTWTATAPYSVLPPTGLDTAAISAGRWTVIDVRGRQQYDERGPNGPRAMNRFRGAVHIPAEELMARINELPTDRGRPVLLVGDMTGGPVLDAARSLTDRGFTHVHTLSGGIWGLRWAVHNLPGYGAWRSWLMDP
ncbi:MAG TPA: rhodanese-like domain-containing protein [Flavobacteriales bacterium]|nr:rhodanese-like domain-containing protein [Flavobacteriales bacterium]HMR28153.1 rhodanese-like domain-containing protein [Flavobacteriales bacterium]